MPHDVGDVFRADGAGGQIAQIHGTIGQVGHDVEAIGDGDGPALGAALVHHARIAGGQRLGGFGAEQRSFRAQHAADDHDESVAFLAGIVAVQRIGRT